MEIDKVADLDNLYHAFSVASKNSKWKQSVQKYRMDILLNIQKTREALLSWKYKQKNFFQFTLHERGKIRRIKSLHISDRVVQRSFCDEILTQKLYRFLIYDNGASIKDKGISFSRDRIETHLHKFYRQHGTDGYILQIDFQKFFDNIPHDKIIKAIEPYLDESSLRLFKKLLDTFKIDVSFLSDEEYKNCMDMIYDSLKWGSSVKGDKYMRKSVGIGSQISQIIGVFYPTKIDNYCKIVKQCKYYGRYMDDIYIIHHDKEYLKQILKEIKAIAGEMGIFINDKKTRIVKLEHGFTFLKIKYNLLPFGKVLKRLSADSISRERRRLKKYRKLLDEGRITFTEIRNAYQSWLGNAKQFSSYKSIQNMNRLFNSLYGEYL